jgi:hypothetical protein
MFDDGPSGSSHGLDRARTHTLIGLHCPRLNEDRNYELRDLTISLLLEMDRIQPQQRTIKLMDKLLKEFIKADHGMELPRRGARITVIATTALLHSKHELDCLNALADNPLQQAILCGLIRQIEQAAASMPDYPRHALDFLSPELVQHFNLHGVFARNNYMVPSISRDLGLSVWATYLASKSEVATILKWHQPPDYEEDILQLLGYEYDEE